MELIFKTAWDYKKKIELKKITSSEIKSKETRVLVLKENKKIKHKFKESDNLINKKTGEKVSFEEIIEEISNLSIDEIEKKEKAEEEEINSLIDTIPGKMTKKQKEEILKIMRKYKETK